MTLLSRQQVVLNQLSSKLAHYFQILVSSCQGTAVSSANYLQSSNCSKLLAPDHLFA